jgi:5-methylcytosine-specific restriction endonuclease McrA
VGVTFFNMAKNKNKIHRFEIYKKDNFSCVYCKRKFKIPIDWDYKKAIHDGEMFLEIDHIIPLSKNGSDKIENKQSLCQKCNNKKSNNYGKADKEKSV